MAVFLYFLPCSLTLHNFEDDKQQQREHMHSEVSSLSHQLQSRVTGCHTRPVAQQSPHTHTTFHPSKYIQLSKVTLLLFLHNLVVRGNEGGQCSSKFLASDNLHGHTQPWRCTWHSRPCTHKTTDMPPRQQCYTILSAETGPIYLEKSNVSAEYCSGSSRTFFYHTGQRVCRVLQFRNKLPIVNQTVKLRMYMQCM